MHHAGKENTDQKANTKVYKMTYTHFKNTSFPKVKV